MRAFLAARETTTHRVMSHGVLRRAVDAVNWNALLCGVLTAFLVCLPESRHYGERRALVRSTLRRCSTMAAAGSRMSCEGPSWVELRKATAMLATWSLSVLYARSPPGCGESVSPLWGEPMTSLAVAGVPVVLMRTKWRRRPVAAGMRQEFAAGEN